MGLHVQLCTIYLLLLQHVLTSMIKISHKIYQIYMIQSPSMLVKYNNMSIYTVIIHNNS